METFFAILKSENAKFDDLTKLFLNHPYIIRDNQFLTKDSTGVPKNCNALGDTDTTNKILDSLQGSCDEVFELNGDRLPKLTFSKSLITSKKINTTANLKQLSDLTYTTNDLELVEEQDTMVKVIIYRFTWATF